MYLFLIKRFVGGKWGRTLERLKQVTARACSSNSYPCVVTSRLICYWQLQPLLIIACYVFVRL